MILMKKRLRLLMDKAISCDKCGKKVTDYTFVVTDNGQIVFVCKDCK